MPCLLVRHKVADYEKWKPVFDDDAPAQAAAGLTSGRLFRNADDPAELLVLFESNDPGAARRFVQSASLRQRMQEGGVIDEPDVYFLDEIAQF